MRELTDADRAALKSQWGNELRVVSSVVETDEGDETITLVVRRPSIEDFDLVVDAGAKPAEKFEIVQNAVIKYAVWPTASELGLVFNADPTIATDAWNAMESMCGGEDIQAMRPGTFATLTPEEKTAAGITDEQIATWKSADRRRICTVFRIPGGLWICRRPGQSEYGSYRRLRDVLKIAEGLRGLVVETAVWPDEDTRAKQIVKYPSLAIKAGLLLSQASEKAKATSGGI